eukprot:maker-scaffold1340_size46339-snap-gene-0.9 protein:Tk01991 transcript:maker-scaffold1340_size46339-snap-gene-0.9-mRNA-1 annotation:"o-glucosyltransferase rumi homolog"
MRLSSPSWLGSLVALIGVHIVFCDSEYCSKAIGEGEDPSCPAAPANEHWSTTPSPRWAQFRAQFEQAQADYEPCSGCACYTSLMTQDLGQFPSIGASDIEQVLAAAKQAVHYQIIDGQVYRSRQCLFPTRCEGVDHFLQKIAPRLKKNIELVVNNHDWPFMHKQFEKRPLPLFSFSKTHDYYDITYPAWTFWAGGPALAIYPQGIGRWDLMRETLLDRAQTWPWDRKQDIAFFRGSRTSSERDNLVLLSRDRPDLIDAQYTKNQAWKSPKDTLNAEPAQEVNLEEHCRYRFLFNYRGVAASFRFKHLFLCGSTVFHVGQDWIEFFYPALKPWYHYIPVEAHASSEELKDLLEFAQHHPEIAQTIASNGQEFVRRNLKMDEIECYWHQLLNNYGDLLDFQPQRNPDLVAV